MSLRSDPTARLAENVAQTSARAEINLRWTCANSLLRLRSEIQKLITSQSARLTDSSKTTGYLRNQYEQLLQALTVRSTR